MIYTEDLSVYNYIKHFFYTGYDNEKYDGVINVYKKYNEVIIECLANGEKYIEVVDNKKVLHAFNIALEDMVTGAICDTLTSPFCVLHGGAVQIGQCNTLLLGAKKRGKSTLTAALTRDKRNRFITDDVIIINEKGARGVSIPIRLRKEKVDGIRFDVYDKVSWDGEDNRYLYFPEQKISEPIPIQCIIFPEFSTEGTIDVMPLKGSMLFLCLLQSIKRWDDSNTAISILSNIADTCRGYRISYDSLSQGLRLVEKIIEEME